MKNKVKLFSTIALAEGVSYIVLLGFAMPLKYILNFPLAVTIVGWLHGILFMLYAVMLVLCWEEYRWSFWRVLRYFIASLLPVLPFFIERKLRQEYPH